MKLRRTVVVFALAAFAFWAFNAQWQEESIKELLSQNNKLKDALARLTKEDQIGYAKVIHQEKLQGKMHTTVKFIETHRSNPKEVVLEKIFTFVGNEIHFDALIVKFDNQFVADGKDRALYLWRRVYSETMAPENGFKIEEEGHEPRRYNNFLGQLSPMETILLKKDQTQKFWSAIWELAESEEGLKKYGITAVYGNAVYTKVKPGFKYHFKISNTGQFFIETAENRSLN